VSAARAPEFADAKLISTVRPAPALSQPAAKIAFAGQMPT